MPYYSIETIWEEFRALIDQAGVTEPDVQRFLEGHSELISRRARPVINCNSASAIPLCLVSQVMHW